jgi:vancomycin aglycone glucosyltransferase
VLAPAPSAPGLEVAQTGAWIMEDPSPLSPAVEAFLDGEPPVYVGLGSMPAGEGTGRALIQAARAVGRRVIVSRGWAELSLIDDAPDCIAVGDVNHQRLFPRLAAVVHHGGAGSTTAAARAGAPQVVAPMFADQFYWGRQVRRLGLGAVLPPGGLAVESLAQALTAALDPSVAARAKAVAPEISSNGAAAAARRLIEAYG